MNARSMVSSGPRWVYKSALVLSGSLLLLLTQAGAGEGSAPQADEKPNVYIGAAKCKSCHSAPDSGNQYDAWAQMKHAKAWETLGTDAAKAAAKERGIADPQKDPACLKCHVTAFGEPEETVHKRFDIKLGVQCESCHGPGDRHMKARFAAAAQQEAGAERTYTPVPEGEIIVEATMETCVRCHNAESPTFKSFCFFEKRAQIMHLDPRKKRTEEEIAAMKKCPHGEPCPCVEVCKEGKCSPPPKEGGGK